MASIFGPATIRIDGFDFSDVVSLVTYARSAGKTELLESIRDFRNYYEIALDWQEVFTNIKEKP